jgi:LuxR family maltose regulon positive regulatory protein
VILITATAGFGKTSLACEWLEGRTDVGWYRATSASADLAAFSVGIAEAVAPIVPGAGDRLRQRLLVAEAPEKAARPMAELMAEDLAEWPAGARLVIDDYHLVVDSSPVEEFMDWLLTLAPGLQVLVTARRRPTWASARRFLHGEILEITARQLAMSDDEAATVLDGRSSESVRRLVAQAQGWPALIGLAALSASAEIPDELVTERLYRYFAEEVVRTQPPETQRFMLLAAVPSSVGVDLARDLLAVDEGEHLIANLRDQGLLHHVSNSEAAFHPLLRDFLRRKLELDAPEEFAALADRVVDYGRRHARWEEAVELAMYRGQLETAAEIIAEASEDLLPAGRVETLEKWLEACGPAAATDPALLVHTEILCRRGCLTEAFAVAQDITRRLDNDSPHTRRAWLVTGDIANLLSLPETSLECHLRALAAATSDDQRASALWGAVLAAAELEIEDVHQYLTELDRLAVGDINARLRVVAGRAWAARLRGDLSPVWGLFQSALPLVAHATPSAASMFLSWAGYVAGLATDYDRSQLLAEQAETISSRFRLDFAIPLCRVVRAHADTGSRNLRFVQDTIRMLTTAARESGDPFLDASAAILGGRLAIAEGDLERGLRALQQPFERTPTRGMQGEVLASSALVEASLGLTSLAREHCEQAISMTGCAEAQYIGRFAELINSIQTGSRQPPDLREGVVALYLEAQQHALLDPVVMAYRAFPPLLSFLADDRRTRESAVQLCFRAHDRRLAVDAGLEWPIGGQQLGDILESLTRREREVLRLVCDGMSNSEIARRLFITESTVKVHVHRIFVKLGVRSRLQAALVARDLI